MINLCTLFNANYLARGMALYHSLTSKCAAFHLYVLAFDEATYEYLAKSGLKHLTAISLKDFEDPELLAIKPTRSAAEYCWTCTPSIIRYCLKTFNLPSCTYLDADMIFYHDPAILLNELDEKTVLITEHRYSKAYDQGLTHGIYCVQFMYFANEPNALEVLQWWRERCLEWCYARLEDGKFGDQKYLDEWPQRFPCVHVLQQPGGGVAPWNLQQYRFKKENEGISMTVKATGATYPVVFFHFHGLKFYTDNKVSCTGTLYEIDGAVKELFYFPYIKQLTAIAANVKADIPNANGAFQPAPSKTAVFIQFIKERMVLLAKGIGTPFQPRQYNFSKHYHYYHIDPIK